MQKLPTILALLAGAMFFSAHARAAECTEITSPYTQINAGGHYCLGANLVVTSTITNAISITAHDVDLDCRGYSIINTSTDPTGNANAIYVNNHRNVHVRNCHIQGGFSAGIYAYQDNGQANINRNLSFTGNTISGTTWYGILAYGTDIEIRDNQIQDVGGRASFAMGIRVGGSILAGEKRFHVVRDNVVSDVVSPVNYGYGIYSNNTDDGVFADNSIVGQLGDTTWFNYGIRLAAGARNRITGNHIVGGQDGYATGIRANATDKCYHNDIRADNPTLTCDAANGNY